MKQSAHLRRRVQKDKRDTEVAEIRRLEKILDEQQPPKGTNPLAEDLNTTGEKTVANYWPMAKEFDQLPISTRTKRGLVNGGFKSMTDVQRATIPHALVGRDVLGAAKTGSGKTLAFLIPLLEKLYRLKWSKLDGLAAIIISPTRELATQTFSVLRTIGAPHTFTAGLVIGGTDWKAEQHRIGGMNILVATPGRLLQHMDESPTFRCDNLQYLVLDEADQILNRGFEKEVNAIIKNLPIDRQTLLFSATQTSNVSTLARLSLSSPEFLSVHAEAETATPDKLVQNYIIMDAQEKLNILWSFIKAHLRKKILVFFQSQRQVRFAYEAFRQMRPGMPVMHLHGKMGHATRREVYTDFDKAKFAILLSTDVAARGLDFEGVHWVIQADCPESVETYIHRVGRTARFGASGRSTLFLLPSEVAFREKLTDAKIPISKTNINQARALEIDVALQALLIQKPDMKLNAQKAVKGYLKSVYLMSDKSVFDVTKIDMEALALSYGLLQVPRIRFMDVRKIDKNAEIMKAKIKSIEAKIKQLDDTGADGDEDLLKIFKKQHKQGKSRIERLLAKKNDDVLSNTHQQFQPAAGNAVFDLDSEEEDDGELLVVKKKTPQQIAQEEAEAAAFTPAQKEKKEWLKINVHKDSDQLITFKYSDDEEEEELTLVPGQSFAKVVAKQISDVDKADRVAQFDKLKEKRRLRIAKQKAARAAEAERRKGKEQTVVTIGNPDGDSDGDDDGDDEEGQSDSGMSQGDNSDFDENGMDSASYQEEDFSDLEEEAPKSKKRSRAYSEDEDIPYSKKAKTNGGKPGRKSYKH